MLISATCLCSQIILSSTFWRNCWQVYCECLAGHRQGGAWVFTMLLHLGLLGKCVGVTGNTQPPPGASNQHCRSHHGILIPTEIDIVIWLKSRTIYLYLQYCKSAMNCTRSALDQLHGQEAQRRRTSDGPSVGPLGRRYALTGPAAVVECQQWDPHSSTGTEWRISRWRARCPTSADLTLDVQDFFTDTFSRGRGREGGGACCTRPVVLGAVLLIWLFSLSVALAVVRTPSS